MPAVSEERPPSQRRRSRYPRQFRENAAALAIDQHRTIADVAREIGVVERTLGNWVRQERIDRGEREGTTTESARSPATVLVIPPRGVNDWAPAAEFEVTAVPSKRVAGVTPENAAISVLTPRSAVPVTVTVTGVPVQIAVSLARDVPRRLLTPKRHPPSRLLAGVVRGYERRRAVSPRGRGGRARAPRRR